MAVANWATRAHHSGRVVAVYQFACATLLGVSLLLASLSWNMAKHIDYVGVTLESIDTRMRSIEARLDRHIKGLEPVKVSGA